MCGGTVSSAERIIEIWDTLYSERHSVHKNKTYANTHTHTRAHTHTYGNTKVSARRDGRVIAKMERIYMCTCTFYTSRKGNSLRNSHYQFIFKTVLHIRWLRKLCSFSFTIRCRIASVFLAAEYFLCETVRYFLPNCAIRPKKCYMN